MVEDVGAEGFQQRILSCEMRIEGRSADIRSVYDLLHGDLRIAFLFQQPGEGPENRLPGFSLPAVHAFPPEQFWRFVR